MLANNLNIQVEDTCYIKRWTTYNSAHNNKIETNAFSIINANLASYVGNVYTSATGRICFLYKMRRGQRRKLFQIVVYGKLKINRSCRIAFKLGNMTNPHITFMNAKGFV